VRGLGGAGPRGRAMRAYPSAGLPLGHVPGGLLRQTALGACSARGVAPAACPSTRHRAPAGSPALTRGRGAPRRAELRARAALARVQPGRGAAERGAAEHAVGGGRAARRPRRPPRMTGARGCPPTARAPPAPARCSPRVPCARLRARWGMWHRRPPFVRRWRAVRACRGEARALRRHSCRAQVHVFICRQRYDPLSLPAAARPGWVAWLRPARPHRIVAVRRSHLFCGAAGVRWAARGCQGT